MDENKNIRTRLVTAVGLSVQMVCVHGAFLPLLLCLLALARRGGGSGVRCWMLD